jgi:UDP-glucose:(heptosyl)LPS alpha-1,3-glucosyltransferase
MQKIAIVIPKYGLVGGAEQFASKLTEKLVVQTGHDFHVYANKWRKSATPIKFHYVPIMSFPKFLTTISFAYFVQRSMGRNSYSLVHSHERIFAADVFTLHGIPHRYWVHNVRRKKMSLYDLVTDRVERKLVYGGNCKKFIAVSNLTKEIFLREYKIDPDKIAVINPGVDLADYAHTDKESIRIDVRRELRINLADAVMVFASMNFEIKGLDAVFLALAQLKTRNHRFKLIVAGKGDVKKYMKMAAEINISSDIIFTGPVSKEKLARIYLAGDMYIMLSKFDTFGMVVLEAMAAGLPAVISGNVGAKDLVQDGINGFIIDDPSQAGYIAAKIAMLLDKNVRKKMAADAYRTAAQNTWDAVATRYEGIYSNILGS